MGLLKAHLGLRLFILLSRSGFIIIKLSSTSFELVLQNCPVRTLYVLDTVFLLVGIRLRAQKL